MEVEFLLVGHGIAGIAIAEHLEKNNQSFIVADKNNNQTSSKIAAGLFNPITGRKMKRTWMADSLFPYLDNFYSELQNKLKQDFFYRKSIYRPFLSLEDQNEWVGNSIDQDEFVERVFLSSNYHDFVNDEFGGLLLKNSGFVDLISLIKTHKEYLEKKSLYIEKEIDYNQIELKSGQVRIGNIKAKNIIFCDGPLSSNPFFNWVPTAPVKGEILHIEVDKPLPKDIIFNRGVFIVKKPNQSFYRVGSTYEWKNLDWEPTEKAKEQLVQKLDDLLKMSYTIIEQVAGVRPASKDRRPLIGQHPEHSNVYLFNGLGTKGVSLAPYFAKQFIESIVFNTNFTPEVNINRYYSLY